MDNSIESRLPFMDYRVVEYGLALPEAIKLRHGYGKWIVRRAMAARIPDAIRKARYKRGFDVQQSRWIDQGLGALVRKQLHEQAGSVSHWLMAGAKIDEVFSDGQLKARPSAFGEVTSLLWLAKVTRRAGPQAMGTERPAKARSQSLVKASLRIRDDQPETVPAVRQQSALGCHRFGRVARPGRGADGRRCCPGVARQRRDFRGGIDRHFRQRKSSA